MFEKGIRGAICHAIHRYAKTNNKCMKNYDKNKEWLYLVYLDMYNQYVGAMSQILPVNGFKCKKTCQNLMKSLWKIIMKIVIKDMFLK